MNKISPSLNNLLNSIPIIIAACLFVVISFSAIFLFPRYRDLNELQKNLEAIKKGFQQQEDYFSNLLQIKTDLGQYKEELAKISSSLPDDPSLPSLFSFLQKASSQSGLVLKGISPFTVSSVPEEFPNIKATQFSLEITGPYSSFKNFVSTLEKSSRIIEVENISFASPQEDNLFTFNLRIKVYSY